MTKPTPHQRGRYDAERVALPYDFNGIFPYLMRGRNESIAYFPLTLEVDTLLDYIAAHKGTDKEFTFFQAVMLALVKVLRARPTLNRYIVGRRLYQRRDVELSFIARRQYDDSGTETNVFVHVRPEDDFATVIKKISGEIRTAKSGESKDDDKLISTFLKLPRSLLRLAIKGLETWDFYVDTPGFLRGVDPLRCSAYVANLGSVGLGAAYHHLFEWGTCSLFLVIGQIREGVVVVDHQPAVRRVVDIAVSLDERIADGYYDARSLDLFRQYFNDPEQLTQLS